MGTNIGRPAAIYGTDAAIEQGTRLRWSLHTGEQQVRTFRGPANKVHASYEASKVWAASVPDVDEIIFDARDGIGELQIITNNISTVTGGAQSVTVDAEPRWELYVNEERVPITNAPFLEGVGNSVADINRVVDYVRTNPRRPKEGGWGDRAGNWLGTLYDLMSRGVSDFIAHMYVARLTQVTTTRRTITAAFQYVGRANGGDVNKPETPDIQNPIFDGIRTLTNSSGNPMKVDWLVRAPQVRQIEKRSWELSQEWWGIPFDPNITTGRAAGWSQSLYPGGHGTP